MKLTESNLVRSSLVFVFLVLATGPIVAQPSTPNVLDEFIQRISCGAKVRESMVQLLLDSEWTRVDDTTISYSAETENYRLISERDVTSLWALDKQNNGLSITIWKSDSCQPYFWEL